ncbi:MAG: hypothetical protein NTX29_05135, partial [Actinobacteria bacterium]|nr:hypothetical protein [Actinomycetota bacterium]
GALSLLPPRAATRLPLLALAAGVVLLAAATTGGKISSVAVVLAGWGLVAIAATVRHELWWKRAWLGVVSITAAMLVVYLAVVAGSAEQGGLGLGSLLNKASSVQGLNPTNFWWGIIVGTALLGLAIVPRWAGVLWLLADPSSRWRPTTVFSVGAGAASLLALLFFSGGLNDTWFALAASAPLAVTSAVGASRGVMATFPGRGWRPSRPALVTVIAGVVLTAAVAWLWTAGPGASITLRWLGPLVAAGGAIVIGAVAARSIRRRGSYRAGALSLTILAFVTLASLGRILSADAAGFAVQAEGGFSPTEFRPFTPFTTAIDAGPVTAWTPTQARAATWLAANASEGDLTATNITYSPFVPALSAQPMYGAGIQYQAPYGRSSHVTELLTREVASWEFINNPSAESVAPLCAAGVDWVWVDPARTTARTWEPYATIAVDEADAIVLRVNPSAC